MTWGRNWEQDSSGQGHMDARNFLTWTSPCQLCGKSLSNGAGIFCGNFLRTRNNFPPCRAAWCGGCYREYENDPFPIQNVLEEEDENEDLVTEEDLETRFRRGRNGDFIMGIPFECDVCHFRNVSRRDPMVGSSKDNYTLMCIRRVNLDAMWSRESSTVTSNLSRLQRDYRSAMSRLSIDDPLPTLGNDTIEDRVGMKCALFTLDASRRPGKYADHLQWDVMRKTVT